jgi:hypothetical protein
VLCNRKEVCVVTCTPSGAGSLLMPFVSKVLHSHGSRVFWVMNLCSLLGAPKLMPHLCFVHSMVFIGEVNISQCPAQYMESVQYITSYCHSRTELMGMPWIINTMGFNKGQVTAVQCSLYPQLVQCIPYTRSGQKVSTIYIFFN